MSMKKAPSTLPGSLLLSAAERLREEGRPDSAISLLRYLDGYAHDRPVLRGMNALWRQVAGGNAHRVRGTGNDNWAGYGNPVPNRPKCLSILDEISDLNWSTDFDCTRLVRRAALEQISGADYDFVLIETAWLGYESDWIYAFTSPGLGHAHSGQLVAVLQQLRAQSNKPIVLVNKEDPLHFEKFLPVMKYADHIFTTDAQMVESYRERTDALSITPLPFAANMAITNPVGRVREPQEDLCFAGSYYSGGYEERARQMNYMLEPIVAAKGVIYDRQSFLDDPAYHFPRRFRPFIRPSVPFRDMIALYRRFKVFLNVNTIVSSPTMMSRRVYELLASGTPVVSAPSRALEEHFPGIVPTASNARAARDAVERLLEDEAHWWKTSQKGIREVALRHQYAHRAALIRSVVWGSEADRPAPLVSIVLPAGRATHLDRIAENIAAQTYPRIEAVLALSDDLPEQQLAGLERRLSAAKNVQRVEIVRLPPSVSTGTRLNRAIAAAQGEFIAVFDDGSLYLPNYLTDMILTFDFSGAEIAGKRTYPAWTGQEDRLALLHPGCEHSHVPAVCGATVVARKSWLEKCPYADRDEETDGALFRATLAAGGRIYSADHFNFLPEPVGRGAFAGRPGEAGGDIADWRL